MNFVSRMWNLKLAAATCCNRKRPNLEVPADAHNNITISEVSEKALATHSSTLARKIPWTEEPGRRQSMGSLRVGHNSTTSLSLFTFMHWRRKWQPTPVFLPGESQGQEAWWAAVYGVAQSRTRLKRLSSSSSGGSSSRSSASISKGLQTVRKDHICHRETLLLHLAKANKTFLF